MDEREPARRIALHRIQQANARVTAVFRTRMLSVLLVLMLLLAFVVPAAVQTEFQARLLVDVLLTLVLACGTLAVSDKRRLMLVMALFSMIAIALRWSEWLFPWGLLPVVREASALLTLLVLAIAVAINVFASQTDATERVVGSVILYLLIGTICAIAYLVIDTHDAGAFTEVHGVAFPITNWLYFSFVTLTTVGYGDILPVSRTARSIATLEALIGQLYPAIIIARLVSMPRSGTS